MCNLSAFDLFCAAKASLPLGLSFSDGSSDPPSPGVNVSQTCASELKKQDMVIVSLMHTEIP